jgi:hypothetical protein
MSSEVDAPIDQSLSEKELVELLILKDAEIEELRAEIIERRFAC